MHRHVLGSLEGTQSVDGLTDDVEHAAEGLLPDRDLNRRAGRANRVATTHPFGGVHRDASDGAVAEALLHLENQAPALAVDLERVEDLR